MIIREIQEKDNKELESVIRSCLIEYGKNIEGCAWTDPYLGKMCEVYQNEKSKYWVVEKNNKIVAGCGIGPVDKIENICELQKMYSIKEVRGSGIAYELLKLALEFANEYYDKCYIETFSNMERANKFYIKNGFRQLDKPIIDGEHYACDMWYIKELRSNN